MEDHTLDGHPRTSRRSSTYETSPLPTMADKLLFILTSVKQHPLSRNARTALWDESIACH
jgi:hypothetical protein